MLHITPRSLVSVLLAGVLAACGSDLSGEGGGAAGDLTEALYAPARILDVDIELPAEDWDALRNQTRLFYDTFSGECTSSPFDSPFSWFEGSVTIDGEYLAQVDVRKKGFIGSLSSERPGLKLDLGEFVEGQTYSGARRLTLNNSVGDPSYVRQCVGYSAFRRAGIAAPRCNFARVSVNGEDLGLYVNVEPLKRPFLERAFGSAEGNLYEGTVSDFTEAEVYMLEPKNHEETWEGPGTIRDDVRWLLDALAVDDDQLLEALEAVLDLDEFYTYWAMEALLEHTDGYAANRNNYYVYADPADGRFRFVPWGIDLILGGPIVVDELPESVYARTALVNRLYAHEEGRQRYFERLREMLDGGAWDEAAMRAEIDTIEAAFLTIDAPDEVRARVQAEIERVRSSIDERRPAIEAELAAAEPEPQAATDPITCADDIGSVDLTFDATWGSLQDEDYESADVELTAFLNGEDLAFPWVGLAVGDGDEGEKNQLRLIGAYSEAQSFWFIFALDERFGVGPIRVDFFGVYGGVFWFDASAMPQFVPAGTLGGWLTLDEAGEEPGDRVSGRAEMRWYVWGE